MADPVLSVPPTECKVLEGRNLTPCPQLFSRHLMSGTVTAQSRGSVTIHEGTGSQLS